MSRASLDGSVTAREESIDEDDEEIMVSQAFNG